MFGPTYYKVVEGFNEVPCLQIKTPTARRATPHGPLVYSITRVYVGNVRPGSIGKAAGTLRFQDLELGKFIQSYNNEGLTCFEMELKHEGVFAFVIESDDLQAPDGNLFIGTQFTSPSKHPKPPLLYPFDGEPHVKVAEALTADEKNARVDPKHYMCTCVNSKKGQAPGMQEMMDLMEVEGIEDFDIMVICTAAYFEGKVYRSEAIAKGAGGSTRSVRGASEKNAVFIGESEHTAVQRTCTINAKPLSPHSTIHVRFYARQLEAPEAPTESESKVGVAPRILERRTSENAIKMMRAKMLELAGEEQFLKAEELRQKIEEKKRKNDIFLQDAKAGKKSCSHRLPDEDCASQQRNYMQAPMILLAESDEQTPAEEVHNFEGSCDWKLQIMVKEHEGTDDGVGERVHISNVTTIGNYRCYKVKSRYLIKVTLKNLSQKNKIHLQPVYKGTDGEEPEEPIDIEAGCAKYELPFPLEKSEGEEEDFWLLKDNLGKTLLKLGFEVE